MKCEKLFQTIESLNEEYLQFLTDICNIESPTEYKEGVDKQQNSKWKLPLFDG